MKKSIFIITLALLFTITAAQASVLNLKINNESNSSLLIQLQDITSGQWVHTSADIIAKGKYALISAHDPKKDVEFTVKYIVLDAPDSNKEVICGATVSFPHHGKIGFKKKYTSKYCPQGNFYKKDDNTLIIDIKNP